MGCSDSKQAAVSELNSMIRQIKEENSKLQSECLVLKGEKSGNGAEKGYRATFEMLLRTLDMLAAEIRVEKVEGEVLGEVLEYEAHLNEKIQKIKELLGSKEKLLQGRESLGTDINESEEMIKKLEAAYFSVEAGNLQDRSNDLEMNAKRQDLLEELEKAEEVLNELDQEIKDSNIEDLSVSDYGSLEGLLGIDYSDVEFHLRKVDKELEELNSTMKVLKGKEIQGLQFRNVGRSKGVGGRSLEEQIKESEAFMEMLEGERSRVKEEIDKIKEGSLGSNEIDEQLVAVNEMIEKIKKKEKIQRVGFS